MSAVSLACRGVMDVCARYNPAMKLAGIETKMDVPLSFFYSLEKKNGRNKSIHSLLSDTGQGITDSSQI